MKVLDSGQSKLSNAEVLQWIDSKRRQHEKEGTQEQQSSDFLRTLNSHREHLLRPQYPCAEDTAYRSTGQSLKTLEKRLNEEIILPLDAELKDPGIKKVDAVQKLKVIERKELTMSEMLMLMNLRPNNPARLQPMLDMAGERFSEAEQSKILEVLAEVLGGSEEMARQVADERG